MNLDKISIVTCFLWEKDVNICEKKNRLKQIQSERINEIINLPARPATTMAGKMNTTFGNPC